MPYGIAFALARVEALLLYGLFFKLVYLPRMQYRTEEAKKKRES
jgi:hypothetical protein